LRGIEVDWSELRCVASQNPTQSPPIHLNKLVAKLGLRWISPMTQQLCGLGMICINYPLSSKNRLNSKCRSEFSIVYTIITLLFPSTCKSYFLIFLKAELTIGAYSHERIDILRKVDAK